MPRFTLIIPAGGSSSRFAGNQSKLLEDLGGAAVIARAVRAFVGVAGLEGIVIATPADGAEALRRAIGDVAATTPVEFVTGGATRANSVRAALARVSDDVEWVAIHDAARPLVTRALIERTLAAAVEHDAAVAPAVAVPWTVKEADAPLPARVQRTLSREKLWALQTPQVARREALVRAFDRLSDGELARVTDDLQVLELAGETTWLVAGDERNIKITTWQDLMLARQFLQDSSNS